MSTIRLWKRMNAARAAESGARWADVLGILTAVGAYLFKLAGLSIPGSVLEHPLVHRVADLMPVALLAALVAVQVFSDGPSLTIDARAAGLGMAVVALLSWTDQTQVWHLAVVSFATGMGLAFYYPAYSAWLPALVPEEDARDPEALVAHPFHAAAALTLSTVTVRPSARWSETPEAATTGTAGNVDGIGE